eukprot:2417249-Prymnesium_polylepis.1
MASVTTRLSSPPPSGFAQRIADVYRDTRMIKIIPIPAKRPAGPDISTLHAIAPHLSYIAACFKGA